MSNEEIIKELKQIVADKNAEIERLKLQLKNPRGAGRKSKDEAWQKRLHQFELLFWNGRCKADIMKTMNISQATYYRYKKEAGEKKDIE